MASDRPPRSSAEPPLLLVGLDHRTAPLELREQVATDGERTAEILVHLLSRPAVAEACLLSTCNRTEVYIVPPSAEDEELAFAAARDLVFLDRAPTTPNANIEHWRIALANLGGIPHRLLVPGHGPAEESTRGIAETRNWLAAIEDLIRGGFEKGLDVTEAIALPLPAWTDRIALARFEFERSVMHLYPKLEADRLPNVGKRS